jgi:hypothetical protein
MSLFETAEASIQDSAPREFFDIALPTVTYRVASGNRDLNIGGLIYTAIPVARGEISVDTAKSRRELELSLPINHAVAQRWTLQGLPPAQITVTAWRLQDGAGEYERVWLGRIIAMTADGVIAKFRVTSRAGEVALRQVPNVTIGKSCPIRLYGSLCGIDRNSFKITPSMISLNGRIVRVDMGASHGVDWAEGGEFKHVPSGERVTIREQADVSPGVSTTADLTLRWAIPGMQLTDAIEIYAGCKRDETTCNTKFANRQNYRGLPEIPAASPLTQDGTVSEESR